MRTQYIKILISGAFVAVMFLFTTVSLAQSKAYKKKKPVTIATPAEKPASAINSNPPSSDGTDKTDKLDIQQLEQKYWAPKDTDFSVVQNRTYSKTKKVAASFLAGPLVNDPFNAGYTYSLSANYYFDERYGVELMFQSSSLKDGDSIEKFCQLSGGCTRPDFNRDTGFYGVGFNWVPFYAKMSFLGQKIIYFDMQVTPFIGLATYEQQSVNKHPSESSMAYGVDVTQYFFFSKKWAVRANLHNRFYKADVLGYSSGNKVRSETANTTMFLMGLTYFF